MGTVERFDGSYRATSDRGRSLGVFEDLDSAQGAIDRQARRRPRQVGRWGIAIALLWGIIGGATAVALVLLISIAGAGG
jgi:hypothetical protein